MKSRLHLIFLNFCLILISTSVLGQVPALSSFETPADNVTTQRNFKGQWKLALLGLQTSNVSEQRKLVRSGLILQANTNLTDDLLVRVLGAIRLQSGTVQVLNTSEDEKNPIKLGEAGLYYRPAPLFILSAGALDMNQTHSTLAFDSNAFPAVRAFLQSGSLHNPDFRFFVESAIPTNNSFATETQEFESTPELHSMGLQYLIKRKEMEILYFSLVGFRWKNLPGSVAAKSYVKGNSVNLFSETLGAFESEFAGIESELETQIPLTGSFTLTPALRYLQNMEAPSGMGQAWEAELSSTLHTTSQNYTLSASRFEIQPDATVAFYGPTLLFNTNRVGYSAQIEVDFKKHGFKVSTRYADAELIYDSPVQSRERSILVRLETNYADF